jgi:hypothetical protein
LEEDQQVAQSEINLLLNDKMTSEVNKMKILKAAKILKQKQE